jgi:hypothetical protein
MGIVLLYILAGQSNMASRPDNVAEAEDLDMSKQLSTCFTIR